MMKEILTFIGVMVLAVIVFNVVIPTVTPAVNQILVTEQWNGVASLPNTMTNIPIVSIVSMQIRNSSDVSNTTYDAQMDGAATLNTVNTPWITGNANLTVNCNMTTAELLNVLVEGTAISNITFCPVTFTNVSNALIDSSTSVSFTNGGSPHLDELYGATAIAGGSGAYSLLRLHTPTATDVNISVNCTLVDSESIRVILNGSILGNCTGVGTDTWSAHPSYDVANPANLTFLNTKWMKTMTATNNTVLNANDSGGAIYDLDVIPYMACGDSPGANISVAYELEAGENITFRFMGHAMGNLSGVSPETFDPDPGWECGFSDTVVRMSFETTDLMEINSNITQIDLGYDRYTNASTIVDANIVYEYTGYESNLSYVGINYTTRTPYTNYNSTTTTITPGTAGTFLTQYNYGASPTTAVGILGGILITLIIIAFVMIVITSSGVF